MKLSINRLKVQQWAKIMHPYANLVIAYLIITKLYPKIEQDFGIETANHVRDNLMLYLDDGFMLLDESLITHEQLLIYLNSMNNNIKFTMEVSDTSIPFLDVKVILHKIWNKSPVTFLLLKLTYTIGQLILSITLVLIVVHQGI